MANNPPLGNPVPSGQPDISQLTTGTTNNPHVATGTLMTFSYSFWKNDPAPLLIVSKVNPGKMIWGINLHYLTFPYVKDLLRNECNNPNFGYGSIKDQEYIVSAFRSYKWGGVRQLKVLDCNFLLSVMGMVRSFDPAEIEIIRKQVQDQIRQQINPKAYEVTAQSNPNQVPPNPQDGLSGA